MSANVTLYVCNHNTIRLQFNHACLPDRSCDIKKAPTSSRRRSNVVHLFYELKTTDNHLVFCQLLCSESQGVAYIHAVLHDFRR